MFPAGAEQGAVEKHRHEQNQTWRGYIRKLLSRRSRARAPSRAVKNVSPPFFQTPDNGPIFYVFLSPTRPGDVIYGVHGQPRSTSETPRRRPSSVVYMVVYVRVLQRGVAL